MERWFWPSRISGYFFMINQVVAGRYRHYKGKEYEVLAVATHSETEEKLVVYRLS